MAPQSIPAMLHDLALDAPDAPAVTCGDRTTTRAELDLETNRLARRFEALGVREGTMVTIALPNGVSFFEAVIATWKLGAVPQPVSGRLPTRERQAIVDLADAALVVGADAADHEGRPTLSANDLGARDYDDGPLPDRVSPSWKAPTSGGSTGRPKLIVATAPAVGDPDVTPILGIARGGTILQPGPLYHNGPFTTSLHALYHGNHVVVLERFDAASTCEHIERHRPDWLYVVPTMMQRIWRLPEEQRLRYDMSSLRCVLHMAAPCPEWLKEAWIEWLGPDVICELYGAAEAQAVTWITGREWLNHRGSVGRPFQGSIKIVADGRDAPAGVIGEVYMRPDDPSASPYRYVGAEAEHIDDGWETVGDMGWMDDDGYLYLADRKADMVLIGGSNVYPAEVEAALDEHPAVLSSVVVGIDDDDLGQRLHAFVQVSDEVDDADLRSFLADRLVRYKIPSSFQRVREPLRDDAGKVRRSALAVDLASR